jgi:hypothetical protein
MMNARNSVQNEKSAMQDIPAHDDTENEYHEGYSRVMAFATYANSRGWRLSDRQLVHEITQRERAAHIREKSSLPVVGIDIRSAAYNRGQADALRVILKRQHEGS